MDEPIQHVNQGDRGAFVIQQGAERVAEMTYRLANGHAVVDHTWVSPALRNAGVAHRLLNALVAWARESNTPLIPHCSYVRRAFEQDPSIHDVLSK